MVRREQYVRLERQLRVDGRLRIEMTFAEVARAIGEQLPESAYFHPAWWGSDPKHTQAVWLDAGYVASPNLTAERVTFTKSATETRLENLLTKDPFHPVYASWICKTWSALAVRAGRR